VSTYRDPRIQCTDTDVRIRWYYPWGTKKVPYAAIRSLERFTLTAMGGKLRIWGTGTFRYWANLDPGRPHKDVGFYLETGRRIRPLITPDDPDAFEQAVRTHLISGASH
jgi:hypothetical protein